MAWIPVPGSGGIWEYNNTPIEPPVANEGQHALWAKQTNGIRTEYNHGTVPVEIYTECRLVGTTVQTMGELSKTFFDS